MRISRENNRFLQKIHMKDLLLLKTDKRAPHNGETLLFLPLITHGLKANKGVCLVSSYEEIDEIVPCIFDEFTRNRPPSRFVHPRMGFLSS